MIAFVADNESLLRFNEEKSAVVDFMKNDHNQRSRVINIKKTATANLLSLAVRVSD
jgi:hypothetical protein